MKDISDKFKRILNRDSVRLVLQEQTYAFAYDDQARKNFVTKRYPSICTASHVTVQKQGGRRS
jgi:hypothetical protein